MDEKTLFAKKYNLKKCYDLETFDKVIDKFVENYYDKKLMMLY